MKLQIISTDGILFDGEVTRVTLPGSVGPFTVLENHASILSTLTKGTIEYEKDAQVETLKVKGGFVDVNNNKVSICLG